ncbi:putative ADP-ribosylation factor GTPase-activating protein agd15-like [Sarracenia purpurea var. burkii]
MACLVLTFSDVDCLVLNLLDSVWNVYEMSSFDGLTSPAPRGLIPEHNTSAQKGNGTTEFFSLLYAQDSKPPDPSIIPSRWATFE